MNFMNRQGRRFTERFYSDTERERALFRIRERMKLPQVQGGARLPFGVSVSRVLCLLQQEFSIDSVRMLIIF